MAMLAVMSLLQSLAAVLLVLIATVSAGDQTALLAFKAQVGGDSRLASWNESTHFCGWEGVTCGHRQQRVVALNLHGRTLTGTLSPALGNLTFLQTLNLSLNWLHGEIPGSLGSLRHLQRLDLSCNSCSGTLPLSLASCVRMTAIVLDGNKLGGRIPAKIIEALTSLTTISMRNNSFTGPLPASLANLSRLQYLDLSINQLVGSIPPGLGGLRSMRRLELYRNKLSGTLPPSLYNLSSLERLRVGGNLLHGSIPDDIGYKFPRMQVLTLDDNRFMGTIPSSIPNMSRLTTFYLWRNRFSGHVPPTLGRLGALQYLDLADNRLEANDDKGWEFITSLTNCSRLRYLFLDDNSFQGQLPGSIVNLSTTLQKLYLSDNSISGSIPAEIGNLVGLNMFYMANTSISGVIPESIGKLENLIELGLYNSSLSGLIPSSLGNLSQLNRLEAGYNNLEGPIPASLGELKKLFVLDLSTNYLKGSIPREILKLPGLSFYLDLSYNSLSGPLHSEVGNLANLNRLILSGNQLSGNIPDSIQNCVVLVWLLLDSNSFEGNIPQSLKNIKGLSTLDLTKNKLSGNIPDALGSIGNLQELYIAHNNLSGPIPPSLQNLTSLWSVDLSYNDLYGEIPKEGVFVNLTSFRIAGNDELCGGIPQLQLAPCSAHDVGKNKKGLSKSLKIALAATSSIIFLVLTLLYIKLIYKKHTQRQKSRSISLIKEEQYPRVTYHALSRGTNGFAESNLLGKGRFGTVYKCILEGETAPVAVKLFDLQQSGSSKSFEAECEALRRVRHRCLIKIITCCLSIDNKGQEFKALVFEFMPNGSLDGWVHPKSSFRTPSNTLSLPQRLDIAVDIMDALDYLHSHCQTPISHCDLKPGNILLAEDMSARVGDFGISRILSQSVCGTMKKSYTSAGVGGSIGYIAPEYGEGSSVSTLGDVYSVGILLLEMFTGRSPTDDMFRDSLDLRKFSETALPERILEIADPTILVPEDANDRMPLHRIEECLVSVIGLGLSCSKHTPRERIPICDAAVEMRAIRDSYLLFAGRLVVEHYGEIGGSRLQ